MQNTKNILICVIIITIFDVILTTTSVTHCVYSNIPILSFLEISLTKVKLTMGTPESLIQFYLCHIKKVFDMWFTIS